MYVVIAGLHGYGSTMINDFKGRLPLGTAQILRAYVESLAADLRPRSQTRIRQDRELSGRFEKHTAFNYAKTVHITLVTLLCADYDLGKWWYITSIIAINTPLDSGKKNDHE